MLNYQVKIGLAPMRRDVSARPGIFNWEKAEERGRAAVEYIEGHYAEEVTLEAMTESASISKSEALRCFRSALQTTPYRYLMDYRLQKAANLLKETKLPISEIAVMTGFNQQSYFGKCFREKMGCAPSDYRKG